MGARSSRLSSWAEEMIATQHALAERVNQNVFFVEDVCVYIRFLVEAGCYPVPYSTQRRVGSPAFQ